MKEKNKTYQILKVASKLMRTKGYKGTTIQKISDKVGIHKSTFFYYYRSKEELLLAILNVAVYEPLSNLEQIVENPSLSPCEKLARAITDHLYFTVKYFDNVNIYHTEVRHLSSKRKKLYIQLRKRYAYCFEKIIQEIKTKENGFESLNCKIVTYGILGMCNWLSQWYKKDGSCSIEQISSVFYGMIRPGSNSEL
jgi:AcrR family transcriptional regulator